MSSSVRTSRPLDPCEQPLAQRYWFAQGKLWIALSDGRKIGVPLSFYPTLELAEDAVRKRGRLIGGGEGLHWEEIDYDLSAEGVLAGRPEAAPRPSRHLRGHRRRQDMKAVEVRPATHSRRWEVREHDGGILEEYRTRKEAVDRAIEEAKQRKMWYVHVYNREGRLRRSISAGLLRMENPEEAAQPSLDQD